jgi:hypothetical protein
MPLPDMMTGPVVVQDPMQKKQMLLKLVDLTESCLDSAKKISDEAVLAVDDARASNVDFAPRYLTTAMRDLQRAVDWLLYLKTSGL